MSDRNPERDASATMMQRTLKSSIHCKGVALHSGDKVTMTMHPAEPDTGILFRRTDVAGKGAEIPARWDRVVDTRLCSVLGNEEGVTVATVEHLMAALAGCGIDNVLIEISGGEVPIMDGSSEPFVFLVECAGVVEQSKPRRVIRVLKAVSVEDGESRAELLPSDRFSVDMQIDFDSAAINRQHILLRVVNGAFCKELARARTFGFLHEVEAMQNAGLAKGGLLDNALLVSGDKILNEDGLRFDDEFVRHKALDAVGDMYLAGNQIVGAFVGQRSGHALNNKLLRALFADAEAWTFDELTNADEELIPNGIVPVPSEERVAISA